MSAKLMSAAYVHCSFFSSQIEWGPSSAPWLSKSEGGLHHKTLVSQTEREEIPIEELTRSFCEIVNRPLVVHAPNTRGQERGSYPTLGTSRSSSREAIQCCLEFRGIDVRIHHTNFDSLMNKVSSSGDNAAVKSHDTSE